MKRAGLVPLFFVSLVFIYVCANSRKSSAATPSEILSSGSSFYALSGRDLEVARVYLLSVIAAQSTPTVILSNGSAFYAMSPHDLEVAQTYLLSQIQAAGGTSAGSVSNLNGMATNLNVWNLLSLSTTGGGQLPLWKLFYTDTHLQITNVGTGIIFDFDSNGYLGATQFVGTHIGSNYGDGLNLSNVTATLPAGVVTNGYKTTLSLGNNLTFTNLGASVITLSNSAGTTRGTITSSESGRGVVLSSGLVTEKWLDASSAGVLISNNVALRVDDSGGNVTLSNGTVVASVGLNAAHFLGNIDSLTNGWATNTAIPLGQTNLISLCSANGGGGITGIANAGNNNDTRYSRLIIVASGNVTFTNPGSFRTSDFSTNRIITNGNTCKICIEWQKGVTTNMDLRQYRGQ